ncbi:membrane protein DedA with SNARE-associated domain [Actinomadura pelletieri DSM 43383]|uniref:Membrane protein DedA with SNARE-associated domain n=2 Tax=Actinomadura pelletieri TaxID=111805 RepID=A0A495QLR8_9ACTN|nr:membrane protein DedA with SNARE-associated domain [Actinomadura pelletieri DSM 43383]
MGLLDTAVTSPWFYLALFVVAALDGFFPVVPSESMVITGGVYAASGQPELVLVVVLAAVGAFTGDHVSYLIGRGSRGRVARGLSPGSRRAAAFAWAEGQMAERGGLILVVARYVPGGRTAVTLTMGAVGFRLRSFSMFAAVAAVSWAVYGGLLGYVGGRAFEDDPLKGVAVGIGLALSVTVVVEGARFLRRRRRGVSRPVGNPEGGSEGEGAGKAAERVASASE